MDREGIGDNMTGMSIVSPDSSLLYLITTAMNRTAARSLALSLCFIHAQQLLCKCLVNYKYTSLCIYVGNLISLPFL